MTTLSDELHDVHPGRQGLGVGIALSVTAPGLLLRFLHPDLPHVAEALLFGIAIVGAAFLLSWAAEVAQLDISAGLAI
ncbi:MAG: sodium:proton exchanger, partial [Actinomycetota bacterium]